MSCLCCSTQVSLVVAWAQSFRPAGLVAPWDVGFISPIRHHICIPALESGYFLKLINYLSGSVFIASRGSLIAEHALSRCGVQAQ